MTEEEDIFTTVEVLMSVLGQGMVIIPSVYCEFKENCNTEEACSFSTVISGHRNRKIIKYALSNWCYMLIHACRTVSICTREVDLLDKITSVHKSKRKVTHIRKVFPIRSEGSTVTLLNSNAHSNTAKTDTARSYER